jgi:hypothetical protein
MREPNLDKLLRNHPRERIPSKDAKPEASTSDHPESHNEDKSSKFKPLSNFGYPNFHEKLWAVRAFEHPWVRFLRNFLNAVCVFDSQSNHLLANFGEEISQNNANGRDCSASQYWFGESCPALVHGIAFFQGFEALVNVRQMVGVDFFNVPADVIQLCFDCG